MKLIPRKVVKGIIHKRCGHCGIYKPTTEFSLDNSKPFDHLQGTCKECHKKYIKLYRNKHV